MQVASSLCPPSFRPHTAVSAAPHGSVVGVYVDNHNLYRGGGFRVNLKALRQYAEAVGEFRRGVIYTGYDPLRAVENESWLRGFRYYCQKVERQGFEVCIKTAKAKTRNGVTFAEADCDAELAGDLTFDALALGINHVILASGDGDFCRVLQRLKARGVFVEVVGLRDVSHRLKRLACRYTSGYKIPGFVLKANPPNAPGSSTPIPTHSAVPEEGRCPMNDTQ